MNGDRTQVVYLFGAGASHACVRDAGVPLGILMQDLGEPLREHIREVVLPQYADPAIAALVNAVMGDETDVEQIITFLDQSVSGLHRRFAQDLRAAFEAVLTQRLQEIEAQAPQPPVNLYDAVLDLHDVAGFDEELRGILTVNYDGFLEAAIHQANGEVDFGIDLPRDAEVRTYRLIKLHGSFGWTHSWPVELGVPELAPLWIPPGILKEKDEYPFNLLWGRARELLDCDVLRIVGCRLGPNDWDLISLLFSTRHTNSRTGQAYRVRELGEKHPYLDPISLVEQERFGERLISELVGGEPRSYDLLTPEEIEQLDRRQENWFRLWLVHMAEALLETLGSVQTDRGVLQALMEAM